MKPYFEEDGITIYHGDCREIIPCLPVAFCRGCGVPLADESILAIHVAAGHAIGPFCDLVLTDPPYGIGENAYRVANRGKLAKTTDYGDFDWDKEPASGEEIELTLKAAPKAIIWGGNYFDLPPSRGWLVWDKQNGDNCFADCELAWSNLEMSVRVFRFLWNGMIRAGEWRDKPRVHPTQKPDELMHWCLSFEPDAFRVIDPFMGSGTTLVSAKKQNREAIGIEIEEKYCEIAAKRLAQKVLQFCEGRVGRATDRAFCLKSCARVVELYGSLPKISEENEDG